MNLSCIEAFEGRLPARHGGWPLRQSLLASLLLALLCTVDLAAARRLTPSTKGSAHVVDNAVPSRHNHGDDDEEHVVHRQLKKSSKKDNEPSAVPSTSIVPSAVPSTSIFPSGSPSTSTVPSTMPSLRAGDIFPPKCFDNSIDVIEFVGSATEDMSEDANGNGRWDEGEDTNGNDLLDIDSGIASVAFVGIPFNLQLEVESFVAGAEAVNFKATRIEESSSSQGTIEVMDLEGNTCQLDVELEPFDQTSYEMQLEFPYDVDLELFNRASQDDSNLPIYSSETIQEAVGT